VQCEEYLKTLIVSASPSTNFASDSTHQKALNWMLSDKLVNSTDDQLLRRFALATLWYSLNGWKWAWLKQTSSECTWSPMIVCDESNTVAWVDICDNDATGMLSVELGLLSHPLHLNATNNVNSRTLPTTLGQLTLTQAAQV
jgi:hypothetical protein